MADTHETIADIIAEKRRRADKIERNCAEMMKRGKMISDSFARELVADIRREADRLEAALKRELGDCAKLREALEYVQEKLYVDCNGEVYIYANEVKRISDKINATLSVPPRNCDRFATAEEARQAWLDDAGNWDEFGSPKLELHEWLYAEAKEGGANV